MARSFVQLSMDERCVIARMHEKKISQAEIARTLRRDHSTICRELRPNFWHDREVPVAEGYWHVTAHQMAEDRRRRYRKLLRDALRRHHRRNAAGSSEPGYRCSSFSYAVGAPKISAIHRVDENCAQKVRIAIVIGTPMNAPNRPHTNDQKKTEKRTRKDDIASA